MKRILFSIVTAFTFSLGSIAQCSLGNQFGGGVAPLNLGDVTTTSTCNYYGEYSPVSTFLSAIVYQLNIDAGGYVTVYNAANTVVAFGPVPFTFNPPADGNYTLQWNDIGCLTDFVCHITTVTNMGFAASCTNPAMGGTTVSNTVAACSGQPLNLSLSGASAGSGLTYQWQFSPDGITYTDIPTGTSSTLSTSQTVMTYYQCIVTCSAGTQATSTPVMVDMGTCVVMANGTATTCGGTFYDSGAGTGNYLNNENYTMTIYPSTPGTLLQVAFNSFLLETCCDDITVYNGNSIAAPFMGTFATNPGTITSSALDGSLTFVFYSDGSVVFSGWDASLSCITPPTNDVACSAIPLNVDGVSVTYNNGGSGIQSGELAIAPPATGYNTTDGWGQSSLSFTTWFTFVAPANGNISISCTDIPFDGQVAVYSVSDCANFGTYTLIAANDNAMDFSSNAPKFTICGLTAGSTYYLMFDSGSTFSSGAFSLNLADLSVDAGTITDTLDVCTGGIVDLFDGITGYDTGGTWYESIPTFGLSGSTFNTAAIAYQVYDFEYIVFNGCAADTAEAQVHIYPYSSAGNNGTLNVCQGEFVNLLSGLSGNVDLGGTWYDPSNQPLPGFMILTGFIPGQFNYDYIATNNVCPNDTSNILVSVLDCIAEIDESVLSELKIYPNPTNGLFYISNEGSSEVYNYELIDLNGRVLDSQIDVINGASQTIVDLSGRVTGMYMVRIFNDDNQKILRIVLQ